MSFAALVAAGAGEPAPIAVNFSQTVGSVRPLHGLNKGPLVAGGMLDLTAPVRALAPPLIRLHDCHWPNPDVVDVHAVFPDATADPSLAASYDFARTDEYLDAVHAVGAQVVYRLGESIEHTATKRFVNPPRDPERWAMVCVGLVRHFNEGWAGGSRRDIRYWEIWNEPENRPAMWTGTDDEYFQLYRRVAVALKSRWPALKVGGPSVGASGEFAGGEFRPTPFVVRFLEICEREHLPLDFFSWHCYTDDPAELTLRARAVRRLLDAHNFARTESHLNEWNYLPGRSWEPFLKTASPTQRERFYREMAGAAGAAFLVTALLELQDAPVEVSNIYHAEAGGWGLFTEFGVPTKAYHGVRLFHRLVAASTRVAASGAVPGKLGVGAAMNPARSEAVVLLSNFGDPRTELRLASAGLPWSGPTECAISRLDETQDGETVESRRCEFGREELGLRLPPGSTACLVLRSAARP